MRKLFLGLGLSLLLAGCSEEVVKEKPKEEPKAEVKKEEPKKEKPKKEEPAQEYHSLKPTPEEFTNTVLSHIEEMNAATQSNYLGKVETEGNITVIALTSDCGISFATNPDGTIEYAAAIRNNYSQSTPADLISMILAETFLISAANPELSEKERNDMVINELMFDGTETSIERTEGKYAFSGEHMYHMGYKEEGDYLFVKVWHIDDERHWE